eukprot:scaffold384705_cov17-Prasinocladus_malaysianus.AAC.1
MDATAGLPYLRIVNKAACRRAVSFNGNLISIVAVNNTAACANWLRITRYPALIIHNKAVNHE